MKKTPLFQSGRLGRGVLVLLLALGLASANPAAHAQELLPELAETAAKHKAADEALDKQKQDAVALASKSYVMALEGIEKSATTAGQLDLVAAVVKESQAVTSGSLEADIPTALPKAKLQTTRKALLAKLEQINADFAKRKKRTDADYLRFLSTLQPKATSNPELAKQLAEEKAALLAGVGTNTENGSQTAQITRGKNAIVNGDFEKVVNGKPDGWKTPACATVETENNNSFMRLRVEPFYNDGSAKKEDINQEEINVPKGAKTATYTAKLRMKDCVFVNTENPAFAICFYNQERKLLTIIFQGSSKKNGPWKTIQGVGPVPKDAVKAVVSFSNFKCPGQYDFDDAEVTFK